MNKMRWKDLAEAGSGRFMDFIQSGMGSHHRGLKWTSEVICFSF